MYKKLFAGCLFSSAKSRDAHASLPATTSLSQTALSGDKGSEEDVPSDKDAIIRAVSTRSLSPDDSAQLCKLPADIAAAKGYPYQVHELGPPKPPCQKDRMKTMEVLGLIDAPPDPELDSILKLITGIFDAPTALIGLFDDKKIFIKDATGSFKRGDFPWRWSFCGWTMASQNNQIMVIQDAFEDARFADNVNVRPPGGGPGVRFYCGTPLVASNGHRLGTLCFADTKPRSFDAGQCAILNNMSEMVVRHIEKDIVLQMQQHDNKVLSEAYTQVERALDCFDHCVVLLDTSGPEFKVMYLNAAWDKLTGIPRDQATGHILPDLMEHKLGGHVLGPEHIAAVKKGMEFSVPDAMIKGMAGDNVFILRFRPATQNQLDAYAIPIGVPSFIKSATPEQEASPKLYFMAIEAPSSVASTCSTRSGVSRIREAGEAIEGLAVGHLLGKGSFGDVYSATWFGTTVAVKVIEQDVSDTTAANLEAALAAKLRHPHIVQTLQHFTRKTGRRPQSSSVNYKRRSGTNGTGSGSGSDLLSPAMVSAPIGMSPNDTPEGSGSPAPHWAVINFGDRSGGPSASDVGSGMIVCTSAMPPVPAFPTFQHDGADNAPLETVQTWIIMEFCNKGCLQDAIDRGWMRDAPSCVSGKPKMPDVLATAYEIASALCYLHCQGVVHGDLSAYNVLLTSTGTSSTNSRGFSAKIADFGLARALGDVRSKIQTKTYGTLTHQPPETLTAGLISKAVDVYSFGVLLWQMYTFSRPWSGLTHGQIVTQVVSGNSKLHFPAGTPQAFQQLAASCMAFKAEDRPTMEDICQTLEEMVSGDYW